MLIEVLHHWRYVLNCTPVRSNGGVANFYEKDSQGPGEATLVVMSWSLAGKEIIRATQRNRFKRTYMVATVLGSHRCTGFSEWILCSSIISTEQILAPKQLLSVRKNCSLIPNCPTPESSWQDATMRMEYCRVSMGDNATETLQSRFEVWLSLESIAIADQMLLPLD